MWCGSGPSPEEAAEVLGISRSRVYRAIKDGKLTSFKAGRRRMLSAKALQEYIDSCEGRPVELSMEITADDAARAQSVLTAFDRTQSDAKDFLATIRALTDCINLIESPYLIGELESFVARIAGQLVRQAIPTTPGELRSVLDNLEDVEAIAKRILEGAAA